MSSQSKKPSGLSRFFSRFKRKPAVTPIHDQLEGSMTVAAGSSLSSHPPTRSVPELSLPVDNSTPQSVEPRPPTLQSRSDNEIFDSSPGTALSMPRNQGSLWPVQQPYSNPAASREHGGATSILRGARGFHMGDLQYIDATNIGTVNIGGGAGDRSVNGMSIPPRGWVCI